MNSPLRLALLAATGAALALAFAGCKKAQQQQEEAQAAVEVPLVSPEERALAEGELEKAWSDPVVQARVKACKASSEDQDFYRDLVVLTRHPHRLAGRGEAFPRQLGDKEITAYKDLPGSLWASYYVGNRLKAMGLEVVLVQQFPVVGAITTQCKLVVDKQEYLPKDGFHAMRPNNLHGVITPPEGLTGRTLYAGSGKLNEYPASPKDAIVVLEYEAGDRWQDAFAMGAKAVIFVGSDQPAANTYHHLNFPANLPRFYVTAELARQLELRSRSPEVTVHAECAWKMLEGRNVIGVIRGTDPRFEQDRPEALLLSAALDSLSEVPELSNGARNAANCAALLAVTKYFKDHPPRRDVVVCFFDGDAFNHAGARAFYGDILRWKDSNKYNLAEKVSLQDRLEMLQAERDFIGKIQAVLDEGNVFTAKAKAMDGWFATRLRLRNEARALASPLRDELQLRRTERRRLDTARKELEKPPLGEGGAAQPVDPAVAGRLEKLNAEIKTLDATVDALDKEDLAWSELERALNKQAYPADSGVEQDKKVLEKYNLLLDRMRELCALRQAELEKLIRHVRQGRVLTEAVGDVRDLIVLNVVMNLGDRSAEWMFIHGDDTDQVHNAPDGLSKYANIHQAIRKLAADRPLKLFEARTVEALYNVRMFAPGLYAHSGAIAGVFGVPNLALMTPMDRRARDGQPCDVLFRRAPGGEDEMVLNVPNMLRAAGEIVPFLKAMGDEPDLSLASGIKPVAVYTEYDFSGGKYAGASANMVSGASAMPDRPARGAFVAVMRRPATKIWEGARVELTPPGFAPEIFSQVDLNGKFELPPLSRNYYTNTVVVVAKLDDRGNIEFISNTTKLQHSLPLSKADSILFHCTGITVVGLGYDRGAVNTRALKATSTAPLVDDRSLVAESGNVLSVYAPRGTEKLKLFNPSGMVALGNAEGEDRIVGQGLEIGPFVHWPSTGITASDLSVLNSERLKILKRHRILETSLERLQVEAEDLHKQAVATAPTNVAGQVGHNAAAAAVSRRTYPPTLGVLNDLVVAVVLLLLLAIPFAYALERLLVGTPHIYRQIAWFVVFFLITFVVLYTVNPAFRIAATPIVIFLAFGIILLSSLVIVIMTRKLEAEVRRMQGLSTSVHSSDVSRLGTMMAAVHMGISTMRRRPIRTLLTAVTVVLLTFTILTFASFGSSWGNRRTYTGPMSGPPRLLVRHPLWTRIDEQVPDMLEAFLSGQADVVPRYWVAQTASEVEAYRTAGQRSKEILVADPAGKHAVGLAAMVGLDLRDVEKLPDLREVFIGDVSRLARDGVFLTMPVARELGLKLQTDSRGGVVGVEPGQRVCLDGVDCTLAGVIDRKKITTYRLLEGSNMLPVDYEASGGGQASTFQQQESASLEDLPEMESAQFIYFGVDRVAIMPAETARRVGGRVASFSIYPHQAAEVEKMGNLVATVTGLPTYLGAGGGVYRLFFTSLTEASGWKDLVIPVVLGGLIIFATMLGSVSDREKEIYAFSALGLAPPHVASLFFAEAGVYAVVGGMGGYLLGQIVARALSYVSETFGVLAVPTMNYSSTNAIATVVVVMCTVLVSTIYPALKASRSANPGIQRHWKIGRPKDDLYDIVFPFTVSSYDITGVVSFLKEHFDNYTDTALGNFATSSAHVFRQGDDMLGIQAEVALAPFDLGVSQRFALLAQRGEIQGIDEIRILLRRLSGTRGDWQRSNRVFVNELRKQLLIWRSLAPEIMERYRQNTLQRWQQLPVEEIEPRTFGATA